MQFYRNLFRNCRFGQPTALSLSKANLGTISADGLIEPRTDARSLAQIGIVHVPQSAFSVAIISAGNGRKPTSAPPQLGR